MTKYVVFLQGPVRVEITADRMLQECDTAGIRASLCFYAGNSPQREREVARFVWASVMGYVVELYSQTVSAD